MQFPPFPLNHDLLFPPWYGQATRVLHVLGEFSFVRGCLYTTRSIRVSHELDIRTLSWDRAEFGSRSCIAAHTRIQSDHMALFGICSN